MGRLFALLIVLTLAAPAAHGDNRPAAKEAFRRGMQHFNLGEYTDALTDFKAAYRNYEDPSLLFNIAQCERQLNHKAEAIRAYKTYLAASADAPNRDAVKQIIADLEAAVAKENQAASRPPTDALGSADERRAAGDLTPHATTNPATSTTPAVTPSELAATPVYKKWWLWTIVGVAVVGAGVGLGVGLSQASSAPATATTSLGTIHPF